MDSTKTEIDFSYDPLQDGKSRLSLLKHMGSDLDVVNDARVSYAKQSEHMKEKDVRLLHYLVKNRHTSPLRGVVFKFRVKAPLFIARQWWKHVIASSHADEQIGWNEQSLRYVEIDDCEDFYVPSGFRQQSKSNKQGSSGLLSGQFAAHAMKVYRATCLYTYASYKDLIEWGVCREQARGVLAPAIYTSWVWTVSLQALLHFLELRKGSGAQSEIVKYAECLERIVKEIAPVTYDAWQAYQS